MRLTPRLLSSWKPWYYRVTLPALCRLGPGRCDAALGAIGHAMALRPGRARRLDAGLRQARDALGADWDFGAARSALAGNLARFAARDCTLDGLSDGEALARFDVAGAEHLDAALADDRGAILLGGHFGGYLAAMHWLVRRRVPMRAMVQRPRHVSPELAAWFDRAGSADRPDKTDRHPQPGFLLRRSLPPGEGVMRVLRARSALRDGLAVYINGDVAWPGGCARPGTLLGRRSDFQAAWADLAALTGAPVLPIFCVHRLGGRFALTIDPPWRLAPGDQQASVDRYLARLEAAIRAEPAEGIAYLLWPAPAPSRGRVDAPDPAAGRQPAQRAASCCGT